MILQPFRRQVLRFSRYVLKKTPKYQGIPGRHFLNLFVFVSLFYLKTPYNLH